ncbi:MAG: radical SAM protein [Deltaproteobacteria bacterium]|nr:radical SAM protein [Deltaproteobacteria bacterium]
MSRKLEEKNRQRKASEEGLVSSPWGGRLAVALVYPNTYHHGMSNLGFQYAYDFFNRQDEALCERFFLPDKEDIKDCLHKKLPLRSLDSGRPLADFDVVCFSISFENDYLNLPILFELGRLPFFSAQRNERHPLVVCGGVVAFLNPEPLADIMDLFAVGEGEILLPQLLGGLLTPGVDKAELLKALASRPGFYVPAFYEIRYRDDGTIEEYLPADGVPQRVQRQWLRDLDASSCRSFVFCRDSEFADMALLEISRGCGRGCRFCAAGNIYLPPRERSPQQLADDIRAMAGARKRVGLVSAAVSDYSELPELCREIVGQRADFSVSSVRIDSLDRDLLRQLVACGHRTLTLAPEAGSQRLRNVINKNIDEEQILDCVKMATEEEIINLKFYFLIGLPTETDEDIAEMEALVEKIHRVWMDESKKIGRLGNLTLSVNPFIPKPFTPFQWMAMEQTAVLKTRMGLIRTFVGRLDRTQVFFESLRAAELQAFLARGDRRIGMALIPLSSGKNLKQACREVGLDPDFYTRRERAEDEKFPWEILDIGVKRDYLREEFWKSLRGELSPSCGTVCRGCGVCEKEN